MTRDWEAKWDLIGSRLDDYEYDEHCFATRTAHPSRSRGGSTKFEPLDEILWLKEPGSYKSRCPIHEDNEASLSVMVTEDGKILVNCFAGCDWRSVQDYVKEHS